MKKILLRFSWVLVVLAFIKFQPAAASGVTETIVYRDYANSLPADNSDQSIAIIGDLQRTSIWEMMLGRHQNDVERRKIVDQVKKEDPSLVILLGDMVYDGGNRDQWLYFDKLMDSLRQYPILPVVGNHEYYGSDGSGLNEFIKGRFPQIKETTWYSRVDKNIALIFLDSNEPMFTPEQWKEQQRWFKEMIRTYDSDPEIKGIMVFMHHPPYTNSIVTGDEYNIQQAFVKPFYKSDKTLAFFSGHAHTYERFTKESKSFIVSGGGGAPRVIIKKGHDCHIDECKLPGVRPFHYILLQQNENSVEVSVKGFNKGDENFFMVDSFEMEYKKPLLAKN